MDLIRRSAVRDLRVDFFRGLALWWIFADHIPGDVLASYSLRNFAMCDATEVFVLLAGYGAGLSYGSRLKRHGYVSAAADVLKRAWTLYIAHIFLFVLFTAQVTYSATALNRVNYLSETRLDVLGDDPYRSILEALLLRFQPSLLNILPLYVVLLVFFAATIWLLRWPRVLFGVSLALYLLVRVSGLNLDAWTGEGWFFDPFAWQFLFIIGVLLACAPPPMPRRRLPFDVVAVAIIATGMIVALVINPHPHLLGWVSASKLRFLVIEDKTGLYPFRLVSILALTWLCVRLIRFHAPWLQSRWAAPFVLIGQNSLPVFCSGIVFGFAARLGLEYDDRALMQIGINVFGAAGMVGIGALTAWYRIKDAHGKARPAPPVSAPPLSPAAVPPATLSPAPLSPATPAPSSTPILAPTVAPAPALLPLDAHPDTR
ncbi:MAG TPA: OpgC domain-containing protein [Rhodopila sp.]|nr:OpgC domain-containing protein [Rhodopila sp.]